MMQITDAGWRAGGFSLAGINLTLAKGQYGVLMGRTGSGKTTLLEGICGLRPMTQGEVRLMGRDVSHETPAGRGIGYVPQDRALFQSMTIRDNLAFSLVVRHQSPAEIDRRVRELAQLLRIEPLLERKPQGLSGGEAQRVALGRALAFAPQMLCLDEPLSALDDETRADMHALLRSIRHQCQTTILHVTHHLDDARELADVVFLLKDGRVVLEPEELWRKKSSSTPSR